MFRILKSLTHFRKQTVKLANIIKDWFMLSVCILIYGCPWEVWRTLKKLVRNCSRLSPRVTLSPLTLVSCSPNFPRASITWYTHAKHEPILNWLYWFYNYFISNKRKWNNCFIKNAQRIDHISISNWNYNSLQWERGITVSKFASSHLEAQSTVLISYDSKSLTWYATISWSLWSKVVLAYDKLKRGFTNKTETHNLNLDGVYRS